VQLGESTEDVRLAATRLVRSINVLGIPSLAMPCGFSEGKLPIGLQILGPPRGEAALLMSARLWKMPLRCKYVWGMSLDTRITETERQAAIDRLSSSA